MMFRSLVFILGLVSAFSLSAGAQTLSDAWKKLDQAMTREIEATKPEQGKYDSRERQRAIAAQLRATFEQPGDLSQIDYTLSQLAGAFHSDETMRAMEDLRSAVKQERQAKDTATRARINDLIKRAAERVRTAKEPRDLDNILKELSDVRRQREERMSEETRVALDKLPAIRQAVERWQDYLAAAQAGDTSRATEILRNLPTTTEAGAFLPRSEFLALMTDAQRKISENAVTDNESFDDVVARVKTLEELSVAIRKLRMSQAKRRATNTYSDQLDRIINSLVAIDKTYREFQAGFPTSLDSVLNQNDSVTAPVVALRVQLLLLMLPRYLGLPADIKPSQGESALAFIDRIGEKARESGDTALLTRTRDAKRVLTRGVQSSNNSGMAAFAAGQNQEAAGQFMLAVLSYQNALKSGGEDISAKVIGERLAAIKAAHADEYDKAIERFLNPPPPDFRGRPYPYFGGPSPGPQPSPAANPVLIVPGGSPVAASPPPKPTALPTR